jgi:hypothetical protein
MRAVFLLPLLGLAASFPQMQLQPLDLPQLSAKPDVCPMDSSSFSNCGEVATNHFQLDVYVDFNTSSIQGYNTINMTVTADGVSQVVLDY